MTPHAEFGGVSLSIEYATTTVARERGLSGRESIPSDYGMLFVFPKTGFYGFWMKDMLTPIDIFWLDDKKRVISVIQDAKPASFPTVFYPPTPVQYVLETTSGFAEAHVIVPGTFLVLKNSLIVSE